MKRKTITQLQAQKKRGEPIVMLTCYDATFARLLDQGGAEMLLVGDSLGMVIQGHEHTLPVTLDEMIYHCKAVVRGSKQAHVVGDLPFGSYQSSPEEALHSGIRMMKEGGVQSVKLEGGARSVESVARLTEAGVPVMGHLGLTPQSVHQLGGYKLQGRSLDAAHRLIEDAIALQDAGAYALVLEAVPAPLAARVTEVLSILTIGIGAGAECDGQVLVIYDLLGLDDRFHPSFLKKYLNLSAQVSEAVGEYASEVRSRTFPGAEHSQQGAAELASLKVER
jgi:3-methyl-2-oxobutanoate hydroxymethyltransferase